MTQFEEDVLLALHPGEWRTCAGLVRKAQQVQKDRGVKSPHVSVASMFIQLEKFEDQGCVASRTRENKNRTEFILTQTGVRARAKQASDDTATSTGGLIPRPA